ncbi:hypothetical protein NFI96_002413, partial [Prochilodus magdalenae]
GHPGTHGCVWNRATDNGFVEDYRVPDFDYNPPNTGPVVVNYSHDEPPATNRTPDNNFAIEKNTYVEIPPLSAISDTGPLEFFIAGHGEDYTDLNNTLLYLRLKITKPDGSDIDDGAAVRLINYPGATIFSQVDVSIGDGLISQSSSTYPYRSIIECLANYGRDTLETAFSAGLFYLDTTGHMDETNPARNNNGLTKRASFTNAMEVRVCPDQWKVPNRVAGYQCMSCCVVALFTGAEFMNTPPTTHSQPGREEIRFGTFGFLFCPSQIGTLSYSVSHHDADTVPEDSFI